MLGSRSDCPPAGRLFSASRSLSSAALNGILSWPQACSAAAVRTPGSCGEACVSGLQRICLLCIAPSRGSQNQRPHQPCCPKTGICRHVCGAVSSRRSSILHESTWAAYIAMSQPTVPFNDLRHAVDETLLNRGESATVGWAASHRRQHHQLSLSHTDRCPMTQEYLRQQIPPATSCIWCVTWYVLRRQLGVKKERQKQQ
jgi:hypothetical protein